jgi:hypothetical protein
MKTMFLDLADAGERDGVTFTGADGCSGTAPDARDIAAAHSDASTIFE